MYMHTRFTLSKETVPLNLFIFGIKMSKVNMTKKKERKREHYINIFTKFTLSKEIGATYFIRKTAFCHMPKTNNHFHTEI